MHRVRNAIVMGVAVVTVTAFSLAVDTTDPNSVPDLDAMTHCINKEKTRCFDPLRIANLSKHAGIPIGRVDVMRASNKRWGTITTELALADMLARRHPEAYSTPNDALARIEELRARDYNYNEIAKRLGFHRQSAAREIRRLNLRARPV